MPKNPTTPPKAARQSERGRDNPNPLLAPKVERVYISLSKRKKRKREEIVEIKEKEKRIKFFDGATEKGKAQCRLLREVLEDKMNELNELNEIEGSEYRSTINL